MLILKTTHDINIPYIFDKTHHNFFTYITLGCTEDTTCTQNKSSKRSYLEGHPQVQCQVRAGPCLDSYYASSLHL